MEIWQIGLGLITATFLLFLRSANVRAGRQKIVLVRLKAYLVYWQRTVVDRNLISVFSLGVKWNDEIENIVSKGGGGSEIAALEIEKKKEAIDKLKESIENQREINLRASIEKMKKRLPENLSGHLIQHAQYSESNLIDGKTFISDEDAGCLGSLLAQHLVELKMQLITLLNSWLGFLLLQINSDPEKSDLAEHSDEIANIIWKGIVVSRLIVGLNKQIDRLANMSTFELTLLNLRGKL